MNRAGFIPTCLYQAMGIYISWRGLPVDLPKGTSLRRATEDDIDEMVALELELNGIDREKDYRYLIGNSDGNWRTNVLIGPSGKLDGFISSIRTPWLKMLGPGVARTEEQAVALIQQNLNRHRNHIMTCIVPHSARSVIEMLYGMGAKTYELYLSQVRGVQYPQSGLSFPTLMPESF